MSIVSSQITNRLLKFNTSIMSDDRPATIFSTSSLRWKYIISSALCYCNFVAVSRISFRFVRTFNFSFQGYCSTLFSPLVLEFSGRFNASVDQVTRVFTIVGVCYLSSALLGMYNIINDCQTLQPEVTKDI